MHRNLKKQVQPALHPIYFKGGNLSTPMWARTPNLKNPVFLDSVYQFSIRLKKLTHVIKVNRFRRGRGGGREARGHQLETQFVCKNKGFMHGDPYLP